jgi:putative oxidoreductase
MQALTQALRGFSPTAFVLLRICVGAMYWSHGLQKLGLLGGTRVEIMTLAGLAAVIENVGGLLIIVGAFTPLAAFVAFLELVGIYVYAHVMGFGEGPMNWPWWTNRGELAATFAFVFLYVATHGAGKWSVDAARGRA